MIRKIMKWTGITLGGILILLGVFYVYVYYSTEARADKVYETKLQKISIPVDSISRSNGEHIAEIRGCKGCHGQDLSGGRAFADEQSPIGILYSANITAGKGGIQYVDEDWIRALRHGLGKDSRSLWFMPSHEIYQLSNQDMACLISYVKTRPPVDKNVPQKSLKPLGRILTFLEEFPLFPAEKIDHDAVYPDVVVANTTPVYGQYLALTCMGCHGSDFKGAPAHNPDEPVIPNITSTANLGKWSEAGFISTLRTGKTPEGRQLSDAMPWKQLTYTDLELKAVYAYLHQLP